MDSLSMVTVRELEVAVRIWHPGAPRTVIAWHGLARHGGDFEDMARLLGPEWRILAPDTPGRGLSSWSLHPAHDYLYSHYETIAVSILDHFNLDKVSWIGTSMGGLLGMFLAASPRTQARIESLVLNDVGPELELDGLADLARYFTIPHRFSRLSQLETELRQHYASFGIQSDEAWQRMTLSSARRLPDGSWTFHYDPRIGEQFIHDTPRNTWADWDAIRCPLMVIRGAESRLISEDIVRRMAEHQPGLEVLVVPGCGHAPMLDRPEQVEPIRTFLDTPHPRATSAPPRTRWWHRLLGQNQPR
ncbi:alpha/beta fold hydrolase [Halomonas binhaiensis]|uniref:Alpha/beta hydrolase n=1 Tax=Halomonas binhaiensis TaxID=2562282 RepID=A0A5C1NGW2_9GAMM|nr:alpha/beta hydrolase [Halomonas binhaiensis]QEM82434.1 alpha/beta hydrolase [Halomonas binhaiensis]